MKVAVIYLRVVKKSDPSFPVQKNYEESTRRFISSYREHPAGYAHKLIGVNCGAYAPDDLLNDLCDDQLTALGDGYDNGTYQEVNRTLCNMDLVVAMNTHVYFPHSDWLKPFVAAAQKHGLGVYGPSASYEQNPHLRSTCLVYHPRILTEYPYRVKTRGDCCLFEHGPNNFSLWAFRRGFPSLMVTADGQTWPKSQWRKPPNIFRRGDQSNMLVWDRHSDIYKEADESNKHRLERDADTLTAK